MSDRWDRHFLALALQHAQMSKDPSSKVGAVIVGPDREILSVGFNGFPRGVADTPKRLNDREEKYRLIVHAEANAMLAAARVGIRLKGATLYTAPYLPCTRCAVEVIQAGIVEVVSPPLATHPERWQADMAAARALFWEAGVKCREVSLDEASVAP